MSECATCGREDGHWLGCAAAKRFDISTQLNDFVEKGLKNLGVLCAFDGCTEPRRSEDKRVKFCETHSDPKNRK